MNELMTCVSLKNPSPSANQDRWLARILRVALAVLIIGMVSNISSAARSNPPLEIFEWRLPNGAPIPPVPRNNPITTAKVTLGRYLFYDVRLSGNQTQSCGSCHRQELAFTDGRPHAI